MANVVRLTFFIITLIVSTICADTNSVIIDPPTLNIYLIHELPIKSIEITEIKYPTVNVSNIQDSLKSYTTFYRYFTLLIFTPLFCSLFLL